MYPALNEDVLFVEEDGHVYASLPGEEPRRLTKAASRIWYACDGETAVPDIVRNLAAANGGELSQTLSEVLNFLQYQSETGLIVLFDAASAEPVLARRLDYVLQDTSAKRADRHA